MLMKYLTQDNSAQTDGLPAFIQLLHWTWTARLFKILTFSYVGFGSALDCMLHLFIIITLLFLQLFFLLCYAW